MQDVHGEEPLRPIDEDFEEDGDGEGELEVDEACDLETTDSCESGRPEVAQCGRGGRTRAHSSPIQVLVLPLRAGHGKTLDHRRSDRKRVLPEVHLDYRFMGAGEMRKPR